MSNPDSHPWLLLASGRGDHAFNMAMDEALLEAMPRLDQPALRFYGWTEPAASFGYFQNYAEVAQLTLLRPLVRRPTGGGIVPHDADWTYSAAFPVSHRWYAFSAKESYREIHRWISDAFAAIGVPCELAPAARKSQPGQCFVGYEQSDVLWHGRKIAGAAQRRTRAGLLIQGSVQPPPLPVARTDWEAAMCRVGSEAGGVEWKTFAPDALLAERVRELVRAKYSLPEYNQKR